LPRPLLILEVKKMNMNKIGMNVKKNANIALSTLLGVITKSKVERSKLHDDFGQVENVHSEREVERCLIEAEIKKAKAYKYTQYFQKC
jgi:hypothetical protein